MQAEKVNYFYHRFRHDFRDAYGAPTYIRRWLHQFSLFIRK